MKTKQIMISMMVLAPGAVVSAANTEIPTETVSIVEYSQSRGDRDHDGLFMDSYPGSVNTYESVGEARIWVNGQGNVYVESRKSYGFDLTDLPVEPSKIISASLSLHCVGGSRYSGQPHMAVDLWGTQGLGQEVDYSSGQFLQRTNGRSFDHNDYSVSIDVTTFVQSATNTVGFGLRTPVVDGEMYYAGAVLDIEYQVPCEVDFTGDGVLNFLDVSVFISSFSEGSNVADLNGDSVLNFFDVSAFLQVFTSGCA